MTRARLDQIEQGQFDHLNLFRGNARDAGDVRAVLDAWMDSDRRMNSIEVAAAAVEATGAHDDDAGALVERFRELEREIEREHIGFVTAATVAFGVAAPGQGLTDHAARALQHLVAAPTEAKEGKPPAPPADRFAAVRQWAVKNLKGGALAVVEALCDHDGAIRLAEFAHVEALEWGDNPVENGKKFEGVVRRVQGEKKPRSNELTPRAKAWKKLGWRLCRRDNAAVLEQVSSR